MTTPVYAVTGASGHLGRFAIEQLLARGVPPSNVVAVVRNLGKATRLAGRGVQVREADYLRPETLGAALAGVNRLLLVSSSELGQLAAQHTNVITAARTAGASRIVYTSMLNADDSASPLAGAERLTSLLSQAKRSKRSASGRARRGGARRSDTARQRLPPGLVLAGCARPISVMMIWNAPASAIPASSCCGPSRPAIYVPCRQGTHVPDSIGDRFQRCRATCPRSLNA